MQYRIFIILVFAYMAQALEFEEKEKLSYSVSLGNMEYYLRRPHDVNLIKSCYQGSKNNYSAVLDQFEKDLVDFSNKRTDVDEKDVINRVKKISDNLKRYEKELSKLIEDLNERNSDKVATLVDKARRQVKTSHDEHLKLVQNPRPWNQKKFQDLEKLLKPKRIEFMENADKVVDEIAKCMDTPGCEV